MVSFIFILRQKDGTILSLTKDIIAAAFLHLRSNYIVHTTLRHTKLHLAAGQRHSSILKGPAFLQVRHWSIHSSNEVQEI